MIYIVRTKNGAKYGEYIANYAKELGTDCKVIPLNKIPPIKPSLHSDIFHFRTATPNKVFEKAKQLEKYGIRAINKASCLFLTSHKLFANLWAQENNIPTAKTIGSEKRHALTIIRKMLSKHEQVILKPATSQGQGEYCFLITRETSEAEIETMILETPTSILQVQEYIPYDTLYRVIVINNKAISEAVVYDHPSKNWKCSVCLNPQIKHLKNPPEKLLRLAEEITKVFDTEISFVDIFKAKDRFILNEINTACNLFLHEKATGFPIAQKIAKYLVAQSKN